ncbi:response regulator [Actinoplanes sp. NPDC051851]|uniref:hybrid sensor histidine kinase/response regulator n=1 Tax=Actinoplanes sp. NPDC051851 TaxID=3154753 RepID=UPI003419F358
MATILVVDDRATNREVARMTLDDGGHHVIEATEGDEALNLARRWHPDVVLADVVMPGMDGYEFVRRLRADRETATIPVLLYTANYLPEEAEPLAAAYGVTRVVAKSADPDELLHAVEEALHEVPNVAMAPHEVATEHLRAVNAKLVEKVLALDESEARFDALADVSPVGIVSGDTALHATYVNPRLADITGAVPADLHGHGWLSCLPPDQADRLRREGLPPDRASFHGQVTLATGQRWLQITLQPVTENESTGFVATIDDVTTLVEAESAERRRIAERFDSLARLSGAVAHDFNNILNIILSFSEFTQEAVRDAIGTTLDGPTAEPMLNDLDSIHRAGKRAAHLAHQLLTFGGREVVKPTVIRVNDVVAEVRGMIEHTIGSQITVATRLDTGAGYVLADANQLSQVLINLAVNARDAMPHGGRLELGTSPARNPAGLPPGEYVHIAVRDQGAGMPPDVLERAMEPFFTTKPLGGGTGLGLATAYGIIRQASGDLVIESEPGAGTTVHIYLPATGLPMPPASAPVTAEVRGGRTVLVADDEDGVREVAVRILRRAGYTVLSAANGQEALDLARRHPGAIDAVLSDVVMPHMNGPELAAALRDVRPETPVVYMSGYAEPLMTGPGVLDEGVTVVGKPFTRDELLAAVHASLTTPAGAPQMTS